MTDEVKKPIEIKFAPGCFDNFEGTQEELDEFVKEITELFKDPEKVMEMSQPVNLDDMDDEFLEAIARELGVDLGDEDNTRRLH